MQVKVTEIIYEERFSACEKCYSRTSTVVSRQDAAEMGDRRKAVYLICGENKLGTISAHR